MTDPKSEISTHDRKLVIINLLRPGQHICVNGRKLTVRKVGEFSAVLVGPRGGMVTLDENVNGGPLFLISQTRRTVVCTHVRSIEFGIKETA